MDYNYERREVVIPSKHFKKDRVINLTAKENVVFSLLWINKSGSRSFEEISKVLYGEEDPTDYEKNNIRRIMSRLRKKGIEFETMYGYGYKLKGGNKWQEKI